MQAVADKTKVSLKAMHLTIYILKNYVFRNFNIRVCEKLW